MQRKILITVLILGLTALGTIAAPLTLEEAHSLALEHNLTYKLAQGKVRSVEAKYQGAKAGLYPQIGATSSYTKMNQQPSMIPGMSTPSENVAVQLSLQQPLYPGVSLSKLPQVAETQLEVARLEELRARQELKSQVASAYYNALSAREMVTITQEAIEVARGQLAKAQAFFENGVVLRTDVLRAELAVGSLRQNLLATENGAALALASLEATLGVSLAGFELVPPSFPQTLATIDSQRALALAQKCRPELAIAQASAKQTELAVELARGGKRPQVALVGNYGWQGSELKLDDANWSVTISARLPLFDGGAGDAKIREAQAGAETTKLVLLQLEQGIALEIQAAVGGLLEAKGRLPLALGAVEQAQEALRISQARYSEGLGMLTEVLEAQSALNKAQADRVGAIYNYYLAVEKLELSMGSEIPEAMEAAR